MKRIVIFASLIFISCMLAVEPAPAVEPDQPAAKQFTVSPIGRGREADGCTTIVLDKKYPSGLLGLDRISHI